jgi:putative hemolysin
MLQLDHRVLSRPQARLHVRLAANPREVLEAQRLRYSVFADEMGARLRSARPGVDEDIFDAYCEHLLVLEEDTGEVVGTYRILTADQARRIGGFYADEEFDLTRLQHLRDGIVEIGRSCVHPAYRNGAAIALLWSGLAQFVQARRCNYVIGCASIGMADGGHAAASIYNAVSAKAMSPIEFRVFPRCALPLEALDNGSEAAIPALIKGYLRAGAYVCGEPAWDPDFNTADLLMLLPIAKVNARYARHFLKDES